MIQQLELEQFEPHLHSEFRVYVRDSDGSDHPAVPPLSMTLVGIEERNHPPARGFSLMFKGPLEIPLVQKIRRLYHPDMGEMDLFLVPVNLGKQDGIYYQALISRLAG